MSHTTVQDDLKQLAEIDKLNEPEIITGRDGRSRPARRTSAEANDVGDEAPSQAA